MMKDKDSPKDDDTEGRGLSKDNGEGRGLSEDDDDGGSEGRGLS